VQPDLAAAAIRDFLHDAVTVAITIRQ
jgi:hypothetical protein